LSSKLLFDEAFAGKAERYSGTLNHYLVMGIVQDDERFVTKRGNMIGLRSFDLSATYTPLQDEIRRIVQDHGPVTLQDIADRLSDTRRLCNDSGIRLVLFQSPDIIQVGRRTFDVLHRFFESRDEYEEMLLAIRISLLEGKKTTYTVAQDLALLSFGRATPHLIDSLLQSMDDARSVGGIHELTQMSAELTQYQDAALRSLREEHSLKSLLSMTLAGIDSPRLERLASLDARFLRHQGGTPTTSEAGELASIIKEFSF
jgi:RNA polymerase primary sigma factor